MPGFFQILLDFQFKGFVAIKFAKFLYILSIVVSSLGWLIFTLLLFVLGATANSGMMTALGLGSLLFGWILALINIIITRVLLELAIAQIRTAQNTTHLVADLDRVV